ncbi:hypothetical protein [Burkholderia stagnalis]|uniref:Head-tail adaptor protein n=1 Tax=Burkholderia stagnalis TaxID=1503054 RepID=A0A107ASV5_9BURK|nr:hypothetical protein [Burkholderia stagnalis]KWA48385.1 hypothetical protein WT43_32515 [Burkholderia stagnalis]KWA51712.1 hypothetical protein WT42_16675 [Burkholderia stagnalis]KWA62693.1 hypothetical protein WT44_13775 [Burkholderia stagnalis]KWC98332.1 hypothetical protein WT46_23760 [Burkholderia stagnalis]KWD07225.1 hypothetical protein WT45_03270 [Burkholderia stagnalis]
MLDLSEVVTDPELGAREISIERAVGARQPSGEWEESYAPGTVTGIVHPASKDQIATLPEGERHFRTIAVFSDAPLAARDFVHYRGARWRVTADSDWSDYGYYYALATRHDATARPRAGAFVVT